MDFLPHFTIAINNAFWFSFLFSIGNLVMLKIYLSHYKESVLKMPKFNGGYQKLIGTFNFFLFQGSVFVVLFMPIITDTSYFIVGLSLFAVSFIAYIISLVNYATSNPNRPVTKGVYSISRNPQQITTIFMWMGIGLMTNSAFIIVICAFQFITAYSTFKAQEAFCLEKYGVDYQIYMGKVPRYLLIF